MLFEESSATGRRLLQPCHSGSVRQATSIEEAQGPLAWSDLDLGCSALMIAAAVRPG
jgi:hypothetical protein